VILPDEAGYDEVRQIWNAMIDRKPALIARCTSPDDVVQAIEFANAKFLFRSAGWTQYRGQCRVRRRFDDRPLTDEESGSGPANGRASVEPGCTLGDFDEVVQAYGLATPLGINSTTGVAGLTLGGGFGWLSRKYGMTIDNLLSAEVVTADGRQLHTSESENSDLFWGLRGGGATSVLLLVSNSNSIPSGRTY
jgi:FAD/FMN-containing dehydrogenase